MKSLIILVLVFIAEAFSGVIPVIARFEGAGSVYGVAYQQKTQDYTILAGGLTGDAGAFGGLLTRNFSKDFELSFGIAQLSSLALLTTYNRGLQSDRDSKYILNTKGSAIAIGSKLWLASDLVTLNFSAIQSKVVFDSFNDENGDEIDLAGANLFDIDTTELKVGLNLNFFDKPRIPKSGLGVNFSLAQLSGRTGQSDQLIIDYGLVGIIPVNNIFSFNLKSQFSDAVVSVNKKYDTDKEVRETLDADCSSISDNEMRARCSKVENQLVDYIVQNNTRGTARPIGGSSSLRSFRELRFKARHTAVVSTELITNISNLFNLGASENSSINLVVFYDQGYASDDKTDLLDSSKYSNGVAARFVKEANAVNLTYASGSDNSNAFSLSFGKTF